MRPSAWKTQQLCEACFCDSWIDFHWNQHEITEKWIKTDCVMTADFWTKKLLGNQKGKFVNEPQLLKASTTIVKEPSRNKNQEQERYGKWNLLLGSKNSHVCVKSKFTDVTYTKYAI